MNLRYLKHIASPGVVPENIAIIGSYLAILVIFPFDVMTGSEISLHILYTFPLILIALHCRRNDLVFGAATLSIVVQIFTLAFYDEISVITKILVALMILSSNMAIVLIARFARMNFLATELLATTDPLTKLLNRRKLDVVIEQEIERQKRYGGIFSIALIDLDGFKSLNDSKGHLAGDKALKILADLLRENTRQTDTIARIGGDEFVILMPNTQTADCVSLCHTLCKKIASRMADASFAITASIGCTTIQQPPEFPSDILNNADKAMYSAKLKGKGCVVSV
jgi:diguanylate cyclase (GGDEF)-like protein